MEITPDETNLNSELIEELTPILVRFVRAIGPTLEDARDIVQTSLIRLDARLKANPGKIENPRAYAFTIARNLARRELIKSSKHPQVEYNPETIDGSLAESPPAKYDSPELKLAFQRAYDALEPEERELLRRHYMERTTFAELGKEMGCSTQNAWKITKRITSQILAGKVRLELSKIDPDFATELFGNSKIK